MGVVRQYSWIFDLIAVLFCSFFLAKITGVYIGKAIEVKRSIGMLATSDVSPMVRSQKTFEDYKIIIDRNIFDPVERVAAEATEDDDEIVDEPSRITGEAVLTSLSIKVLGVLAVGDGRDRRSTATISGGGDGKRGDDGAGVYAVGAKESFAPNTVLTRVLPHRIEFLNSGKLEYAEVFQDLGDSIFGPPRTDEVLTDAVAAVNDKKGEKPLVKDEGGKFMVDQREVDNALTNLDKLYTDIRAVPNFSGGKVSGMKILSVKNDSIFAKLGLRRGDVLQKINGMELDVKQGFAIFSQLKDEKRIVLDLVRQSLPTTLEYEIR